MRAVLAIVLVALLFVCAQSRIAYNPYAKYAVRFAADEEEADAEFFKSFMKKVGKVALDAGKMYVGQKYGIQLDAEDEEEADAEFLGKALKKVGKVALSVGKIYARSQGIPIDEAEEESDAEFLGKALKKVGKVALQVGKAYVGQKYGINLDEEEEEADAEFFKNVLKKVGKVALQAGKAYLGAKTGIQLDEEEEESDFINWKKIGSIAKDIGKTYLSSKYGINLDEEEESDSEFLSKLKNWWNTKGKDLAIKGLQIYSQVKNGGAQQGDEAEEESDSMATDCGESYTQGRATGRKQCVTIDGNAVVTSTAEVYNRMKAAAAAAGVHLKLNSGFRTNAEQTRLYNCYLTKKCNNGNLAAKPGFSNHQNGIALDISVTNPATYNWLVNNASKFGFVRTVASEKWHWELRNSRCNAFVSYSCK